MGTMRVLTLKDGDRAVAWAPEDTKQTEEVQKEFDQLMHEGYRAYEFPSKGAQGAPTKTFNPGADEIIVTARGGFQGG